MHEALSTLASGPPDIARRLDEAGADTALAKADSGPLEGFRSDTRPPPRLAPADEPARCFPGVAQSVPEDCGTARAFCLANKFNVLEPFIHR